LIRVSGRRAGQRFDAEHGVTTEALLFLAELDPEAIGDSLEYATHYEPSPVAQADALLDASPLRPQTTTFVDLGAGMGRVVLLAARREFRAVIGVEISPALVEIARENLATARDPQRVARDVKIVRADAAEYTLPHGDLVVYMYNPFRGPVLDAVLARLCDAGERGEVVVLYHTAVEQERVEALQAFERIADLGFGLAYRSRRASRAIDPSAP
jgi:SAM-dependent methyltransferase